MITMEDLEEHGMELKDFFDSPGKTEEFFYTVMDELDLPDNFKIVDAELPCHATQGPCGCLCD